MMDVLDTFCAAWQKAARRDSQRLAVPALPGAAAAAAAIAAAREYGAGDGTACVVVVAPGPDELESLYSDLRTLTRDEGVEILLCPPAEEVASANESDSELAGTREASLRRLRELSAPASGTPPANGAPVIFVTTIRALLSPIPDPDALRNATVALRVGSETPFEELVETLSGSGYDRQPQVVEKGQMAVRGGILDVWPLTSPLPARIEFFGDTVESLRSFDPATQVSIEQIETFQAMPVTTAELPSARLVDWIPVNATILWLDHDRLRQEAEEAAYAAAADDGARASTPATVSDDAEEFQTPHEVSRRRRARADDPRHAWDSLLASLMPRHPRRQYFCGEPAPPKIAPMRFDVVPAPGLGGLEDSLHPDVMDRARHRLLAQLSDDAARGETVHVFLDTASGCEWLAKELGEDSPITLTRGVLSGGFALPSKHLTVIAQSDLYAIRKRSGFRSIPPSVASRGGRIDAPSDLNPGDLVVHVDHGVGRFLGTTVIELDGDRSEVFSIEYADGAKLHVPVSQAHLLSRYIGVGGTKNVRLHKLGGKRWTREKVAAERAVADLASALLETQARRAACPGIAFDVSPEWMEAFEAAFPYRETPDQLRVIAEVKEDMARPRPMDRLVCGDAGYGKTEVAIRAAFIAAMNGRQVAVLVPTTVLAEQHYESFLERMGRYPIRIAVLSRFRTMGERQRTLDDLAAGRIDIVIGTHALLQPGIRFKDLGLVVLDEEQRFGVIHKERLKQVRAMVDVLTLTATPIPRTLYLGMTGARDLSLLQTPPQERLAIETKLVRDTDAEIRSAIMRELRRDGQVYYLYNRVLTIGMVRERLVRLVPEARIAVAHGQMPPAQLASVMQAFGRGEFDVLLCTTIAESGLDIPRANTIIIDRADRLGMADLYQLRGRVGRSSHRGFAYLLLPQHGHLDNDARERLSAIQRHGGLGGGFNLAMRDLEIRGAGNLLGAAQSGHIAAIGFGLYCQLLKRTVARLKGEKPPMLVDVAVQIDGMDLSPSNGNPDSGAALPYSYVEEDSHRIEFHRRIAEASDVATIRAIRGELTDRFGKMPPEAVRMLRLAELRIVAARAGVRRIAVQGGKALIFGKSDREPYMPNGRIPRIKPDANVDKTISAIFKILGGMNNDRKKKVDNVLADGVI